MSLSPEQYVTLKAHIQANTTVLAFSGGNEQINTVFGGASINSEDAQIIADHYNLPASPSFFGFPADVSVDAIIGATIGQNFSEWVSLGANAAATNLHHNAVDLLLRNGRVHPQNVEVRNALAAIFPAGTAPNSRLAILNACARLANNAEKALSAVGTGPGGGNGGAITQAVILLFEGTIEGNDVSHMHGLPT